MAITATQVKELRERTGSGMMECKKALTASNGDIDAAIEAMRKSGQAKAAKKAGRVAAEGIIVAMTSAGGKKAVILEINSETDFVARDENFTTFVNAVAKIALDGAIDSVDVLSKQTMGNGTVETTRGELVSKLGENIQIRRVSLTQTDGVLGGYIHGGRIGAVVALQGGDDVLAKDIAMHVAATNPEVISPNDVSAERISKEKEIFVAQAAESGKPADIVEKMIAGKLKKFGKEVSLLGQPFVKQPDISVEQLLKEKSASVTAFARYEVGEGIEKQESNFADEVMAQVKDSQ
jgi:elongation factor Ts